MTETPDARRQTPEGAGGLGNEPVRLGVLLTYLRPEEKLILAAARARDLTVTSLFDRDLTLDLAAPTAAASGLDVDVVLDRGVAHARSG